MYHCEVLHAVLDTLLLAQRNGVPVPPALPEKALAMCRALAVWAAPDRDHPAPGGQRRHRRRRPAGGGGLLFRDPLLAAAARGPVCEGDAVGLRPRRCRRLDALPRPGRKRRPRRWRSAATTSSAPAGEKRTPMSTSTPGAWGGGHGHADLLHIDVYHGGEAVLTDPGRLTYVDGDLRRTLKGPAAHNTLRLDGEDFTAYRGTWEWGPIAQPLPVRARFAPQADCLAGGHLGYLERGAAVERRLHRPRGRRSFSRHSARKGYVLIRMCLKSRKCGEDRPKALSDTHWKGFCMNDEKRTGRVTIPTDLDAVPETLP